MRVVNLYSSISNSIRIKLKTHKQTLRCLVLGRLHNFFIKESILAEKLDISISRS